MSLINIKKGCFLLVLFVVCFLFGCDVNAELLGNVKTSAFIQGNSRMTIYKCAVSEFCKEESYCNLLKCIKSYPAYDVTGKDILFEDINTVDDLVVNVEHVFIELYGEESLSNQKPYVVVYDTVNDLWLIHGNNKVEGADTDNVASAIVSKETGELLAVWSS